VLRASQAECALNLPDNVPIAEGGRKCGEELSRGTKANMDSTNRKIFWILFTVLSLAGYFLPFVWAIVEMFFALWLSWWIVYRSGLL
jgi:hypothetical protein